MSLRNVAGGVRDASKNATVRFSGGILSLLFLGIGCLLTAHYLFATDGVPFLLTMGLGEAILVSAILAMLVDPYLKRRLRDESGWEVLFGYLSPMAPKHLRDALKELANCKIYNTRVVWTVQFEWHDDAKTVLVLTIESFSAAINLDRKPRKIDDRPFVLASTDGYQTEYLRYGLNCPNQFQPIDARGADLQPYIFIHNNGSISLDDLSLSEGRLLPSGVHFENIRVARMYRRSNGYLPLQHGKFAERVSVVLKGEALNDLDVIVAIPRRVNQRELRQWLRPAGPPDPTNSQKKLGQVSPGQTTLVSWGPAKVRSTSVDNR